jgi:hypothetical protein
MQGNGANQEYELEQTLGSGSCDEDERIPRKAMKEETG